MSPARVSTIGLIMVQSIRKIVVKTRKIRATGRNGLTLTIRSSSSPIINSSPAVQQYLGKMVIQENSNELTKVITTSIRNLKMKIIAMSLSNPDFLIIDAY